MEFLDTPIIIGQYISKRDPITRDMRREWELVHEAMASKGRATRRSAWKGEVGAVEVIRDHWRYYLPYVSGIEVREKMLLLEASVYDVDIPHQEIIRVYAPLGEHWEIDVGVYVDGSV